MSKASSLQEFLAAPESFTELNLSGQNISDAASIVRVLVQNSTLKSLYIKNSNLSEGVGRAIGEGLAQNSTLTSLYIQGSNISGGQAIRDGVAQNNTLMTLNLDGSNINAKNQINELMRGRSILQQSQKDAAAEDSVPEPETKEEDDMPSEPERTLEEIEQHLTDMGEIVTHNPKLKNLSNLIAEGNERITESSEKAILIMGNTGAGKTTLAHMLTKQPLRSVLDDERGEVVLEAVNPSNQASKIGHGYDSETTIPNKFMADDVAVWDCPGFGDTSLEQGVANSFYIQRLVSNSQQVMLVLTVDAHAITSGARGNEFISILESFMKTFNNTESLAGSVALVVTHVESHKQMHHIVRDIQGRLAARDEATDAMREVVSRIIDDHSVYLVHKPQGVDDYQYPDDLLASIEGSCTYAEIAPDSVNVTLSGGRQVEFVQRLLDVTEHNINIVLKLVQEFIVNAQMREGTLPGDGNILVQYHDEVVSPLLPNTRDDYRSDQLPTHFPHLKQLDMLSGLFAPYEQLSSVREGVEMMVGAVRVVDQIFGARDVQSPGATIEEVQPQPFGVILNNYAYILLQQCNYFQFLAEVIVINSNDGGGAEDIGRPALEANLLASMGRIIAYCKQKVSSNMQEQVTSLTMDEGAESEYYLEAIEYFAQYTGNSNENVSKIAHGNIAKAEMRLAEIAERELAGAPDAERAEEAYQEVIDHYARAVIHNKEIAKIYSKLGQLFFEQHSYDKAIACYKVIDDEYHINESFKAWLAEDRENPEIWLKRGDSSMSFGQHQKALKYYGTAFGLSDDESFKEAALHKRAEARASHTDLAAEGEQAAELHRNADTHNFYHFDTVDDEFTTQILGVGVDDGAAVDADA